MLSLVTIFAEYRIIMHYGKYFHMDEDGGSKFLSLEGTETGDFTGVIFFFRKKKDFFSSVWCTDSNRVRQDISKTL